MVFFEKHIIVALTISAIFLVFNMIAVTSGNYDQLYSSFSQFFSLLR